MWGAHEGMGWWMVWGVIWMVVFWGLVVGLIVWGVSRLTEGRGKDDSPVEIARRRYARGEITRQEFEQIRRDLQ